VPMLDEYVTRLLGDCIWVIEQRSTVRGVAVILAMRDHMFLENIAVDPTYQGIGLGRQLLAFAEMETIQRGYSEIRLYTHNMMTKNQRLYAKIGYAEMNDSADFSRDQILMRKLLKISGAE